MNYTYDAGKHLRGDLKVRPYEAVTHTQRPPLWRRAERESERWCVGAAVVKGGVYHDWAARSRLVHVCVSSYHWNLLQALVRAATER